MIETAFLFAVLFACVKPLGAYMAHVYGGQPVWLEKPLGWLEHLFYRAAAINPKKEMHWRAYAGAVMMLSLVSFLLLFTLLLSQGHLPLNPDKAAGLSPDLAFNVAISFLTNTNWQSYVPEQSLSYLSQMAGLSVQNFLSAATGMAAAVAFFRAFTRKQNELLGNFWADLVRGVLYILLPLSVLFALLLASQGVVQTFHASETVQTLEGATQQIALGPVASQEAIKQLGSNGGGYFNANSAHPFENPTPLSNFFETLAILLIPASLVYTFGVITGDRRQSWTILAAMTLIFLPLTALCVWQESITPPALASLPLGGAGGNMEGKEVRFGAVPSAIWSAATTATSNGSVNAMHDSFQPLSGMAQMMLMQLGEIIFGGVGSGMIGMLTFVIVTVFIGGLMVGRTPEYLGKKFGPFEIKMASLIIITPAALILFGASLAVSTEAGRAGVSNPGAHGFSEILYALSSAANNNGSAFAGLSANSVFYNTLLGVVMFFGRFFILIPALAMAGSIAAKNTVPPSAGTLPTHTPLFALMLVGVILLLGVLTFAPALALGPVVEHLQLTGK